MACACATFKEAAEKRGLLETTNKHYDAFTDIVARAAQYQPATALRMLVAQLTWLAGACLTDLESTT